MEISDIRRELGLENIDLEDIDRIKFQLQQINDTIEGGLRSANLKEYRNTYVVNAQDSLDSSYPFLVHFNIIGEMTRIVSIKLSFWFLNFRAYSTAATEKEAVTSGASSAESSASGGGETPTSGASSASSSGGGGVVSSAAGGVVSSASGGGPTSGSDGADTRTSGASGDVTPVLDVQYITGYASVTNVGNEGVSGRLLQGAAGPINVARSTHTHTVSILNHTHSVPSHTHTGGSHTHTGGTHTHNIEHTHTVTIAAHTHNIPHTHTFPAHSHDITYGIFEEETSPTIVPSISRDNGLTYSLPIGSYTKDQENLDITRFIDKAGSKMIKFTSNARARLSVQITMKLDIKAR